MAVFDQVFWNTVNGRFWEFSLEVGRATPYSYFAIHFSPFLILLIPFYFLFPYPQTLLLLQSSALALGLVPIYFFALEILKSMRKATFVAGIYLLSPFVQNIALFDFHEVAFFIPIFGFCLLFAYEKRWLLFFVFLVLSLSIKEEVGLITLGLGSYLLFKKNYKVGLSVIALSLGWLITVFKFIIPSFASEGYKFASYRYTDFGTNPGEIIRNIILNPLHSIEVLLKPRKLYFLGIVFGSTGFVSLLGGSLLVVLGVPLLYLLLSSYNAHYSYTAQYSAVLLPTLFFALVLGLKSLESFKYRQFVYFFVLGSALVSSLLFGQLPGSRKFDIKTFQTRDYYSDFEEIAAKVPQEASLSAPDFVLSHLSQRRYLELYDPATSADFIFFDSAAVGSDRIQYEQVIESHEARGYLKVDCRGGLCLMTKLAD
jgi:uncharacterized membrane protein